MLMTYWIVGMLLAFGITILIYQKAELGRILIVSQSLYYCLYVVVSGVLIWINHFNLYRGALLTFLLELVFGSVFFLWQLLQKNKGKRKLSIGFNWKEYLPLAIILLLSAFLVQEKAGIYGTGQDQGLYQIRAMMYLGGYNDNVIDFPEYYFVENNWEKSQYLLELEDMVGFYLLKNDGHEFANDVNGVLHGIATFPALLGLWGKIFGLVSMPGILTVFYLLYLANLWLICDNMKFKTWVKTVVTTFLAVSPIVVWSAKQTLTEIALAMMIALFFMLLTEKSDKKVAFWSFLPLLAICYYHVVVTVLIPLFVILYVVAYLQTKSKGYLGALLLSMIGYATGFSMMLDSARHYTLKNFAQLFGKTGNLLNEENVELVIWVAAISVMVLSVVLFRLCERKRKGKQETGQKLVKTMNPVVKWGLNAGTIFVIAFMINKAIVVAGQDLWIMKLSILGYLFLSGFVMLPMAFLGVLRKSGKASKEPQILLMSLSFLYVVFLYCGILWVNIYYYYYYARYLTPFIFLVLVVAGLLLNDFNKPTAIVTTVVGAGIVYLMLQQSSLLYEAKDLTYGSYEQLDEMVQAITAQEEQWRLDYELSEEEWALHRDVILVYDQGYHIPRRFALALKALTGADILYFNYDRMANQLLECKTRYQHIYLVQYDLDRITEAGGEWTYLYRGIQETSLYDSFVTEGLPYAKEAITLESPVSVLLYNY